MQPFTVRPATPADADAVTDVWVRSWLDTYVSPEHGISEDYVATHLTRRSSKTGREALRRQLARGHSRRQAMFVAEADGRIVGLAGPRVDDDGTQRLGALYVDRDWHGRGPGPALMLEVLHWRDPGKPLVLDVAVYNRRAIAFYRKWGFREVPDAASSSGLIPLMRMELPAGAHPVLGERLPSMRRRRDRRFPLGRRRLRAQRPRGRGRG